MQMISCKINVSKILKEKMFKGQDGTYLDITLLSKRDGEKDRFGNDFMIVQDLGKEARLAGQQGPILGNGKFIGGGSAPARGCPPRPSSQPASAPAADDDAPGW